MATRRKLIFLDFWFLTASKTKLKQEQKQSKEIGTETLPFPVASKSPATAPEKVCLMATSWWTPRGRLWCRQQQIFPWIIYQRFNRTSRTWRSIGRLLLMMVVPSTTWNLHRNKPELCPTRNREVVNPSGLAEQRVKSNVWKTVGIASNSKQMIAAGVVNSM